MTNPDSTNEEGLEKAIDSLLADMTHVSSGSDEYKAMADQLVKLYNLKKIDHEFRLKTLEEERLMQVSIAEQFLKEKDSDADRQLKTLEAEEKKKILGRRWNVNPDTVLLVAGNLAGILAIISYEHGHVIVSKALNNVLKPR